MRDLDRGPDARNRIRVLFISELPPIPTVGGNMQRTNLISRALGSLCQRDLLLMNPIDGFDNDWQRQLREEHGFISSVSRRPWGDRGLWRAVRPFHPTRVDQLAFALMPRSEVYSTDKAIYTEVQRLIKLRDYDLIVGRYLRPTCWSGASSLLPVVLDLDDLDTQVLTARLENQELSWPTRVLTKRHSRQLMQIVPHLLRQPKHVWVANSVDLKDVNNESASVLPNIPFPSQGSRSPIPPCTGSRIVLSVGGMGKAVLPSFNRFIESTWPKIRNRVPNARFRIVGTGISDALKRKWRSFPGVEPVGFVDDLTTEYAQCAFTLVPFAGGGGTKIKVLESLSWGRTCLMYKHANRGFDEVLKDRESVWLANDEDELVTGCVRLLFEPTLTELFGKTGARAIANNFSYSTFESEVHRTIINVLSKRRDAARLLTVNTPQP